MTKRRRQIIKSAPFPVDGKKERREEAMAMAAAARARARVKTMGRSANKDDFVGGLARLASTQERERGVNNFVFKTGTIQGSGGDPNKPQRPPESTAEEGLTEGLARRARSVTRTGLKSLRKASSETMRLLGFSSDATNESSRIKPPRIDPEQSQQSTGSQSHIDLRSLEQGWRAVVAAPDKPDESDEILALTHEPNGELMAVEPLEVVELLAPEVAEPLQAQPSGSAQPAETRANEGEIIELDEAITIGEGAILRDDEIEADVPAPREVIPVSEPVPTDDGPTQPGEGDKLESRVPTQAVPTLGVEGSSVTGDQVAGVDSVSLAEPVELLAELSTNAPGETEREVGAADKLTDEELAVVSGTRFRLGKLEIAILAFLSLDVAIFAGWKLFGEGPQTDQIAQLEPKPQKEEPPQSDPVEPEPEPELEELPHSAPVEVKPESEERPKKPIQKLQHFAGKDLAHPEEGPTDAIAVAQKLLSDLTALTGLKKKLDKLKGKNKHEEWTEKNEEYKEAIKVLGGKLAELAYLLEHQLGIECKQEEFEESTCGDDPFVFPNATAVKWRRAGVSSPTGFLNGRLYGNKVVKNLRNRYFHNEQTYTNKGLPIPEALALSEDEKRVVKNAAMARGQLDQLAGAFNPRLRQAPKAESGGGGSLGSDNLFYDYALYQ